MKINFTKEEIKFMRALILQATVGGGLVDIAHDVKKELERNLDAKDLLTKRIVKKETPVK